VWRRALARLGFASTGILYVAIGVTAARVALSGARDRSAGMPGALRLLLRQPHGRLLAAAVAAGLAAFMLWHLLEARRGRGRPLERAGHLLGAAGYAALTWSTVALLLRLRHPGPAFERNVLAWLLSRRAGVLAVEAAGALTIGAGLFEIWEGVSGRLRNRFATRWLSLDTARVVKRMARFGLAARGVVLVVIGVFQERVAVDLDPRELTEIGGALRALSRSPAGGPLLAGVVALGLVAYGLYMGVLAVAAQRS
jgi:Domain of Unknown Function (DUF1206)